MKDLLPIPATDPTTATPDSQTHTDAAGDGPTLSHALAAETRGAQGPAQPNNNNSSVVDLGWNEKKENIAASPIEGMTNEELWLLVRRFNKQIYNVKATPYPPPGGLDLNIAEDEEFSPDKLRANIERLYMTVGVGLLAASKHVARLRSWQERRRTTYLAGAYFVAWAFDFLMPLLSVVVLALIGFPRARELLFPPAPLALVDSKTGGIQKPKAGVLGSHDSATGALENHKGEAVEQEASNFVSGIASVAMSSAAYSDEDPGADTALDPTALATKTADARDKAGGEETGAKHDKTKVPMEKVMWNKMRPVMHTIGTVADTWERLANALSPIPLFPSEVYRLRLVAILLPLLLGSSLFLTPYLVLKLLSFLAGAVFFGDPVISRCLDWLNRTIPNWPELLQPRNTILNGVPTNAQLTLTLLRHGEVNHAPLPPPPPPSPRVTPPPPDKPAALSDGDLRAEAGGDSPLGVSNTAELDSAITYDPSTIPHETNNTTGPENHAAVRGERDRDRDRDRDSAGSGATTSKHGHGHGHGHRILGFFKGGTTRGAVKTAVGADKLRAKTPGSAGARDHRLGVLAPGRRSGAGGGQQQEGHGPVPAGAGPAEFEARWEGHRGRVYVSASGATVPVVAFGKSSPSTTTTTSSAAGRGGAAGGGTGTVGEEEELRPMWSVPAAEVVEMLKIGGYAWKAKLVVGWSMGTEVKDGLVIRTVAGDEYKITAVPMRDELFNQLIALGGQKWEAR
ncbi:hypothetical protein MYCTH_103671 [Thermothelomyces thermophilus ATCC 42464]|uniref:Uncharacterized protein n=1 Tax=Thermothelomyces thermophilus (strain ATCC 42464 / BCRC 31852 / DSM 1799) TaxID=573729 RepID=G2QJA1_THET4|nr:uncharacterized protein MYCTH_103671 [Thermothelomyces thermophilus ATCC 42464]AEO59658.1 hypothetical protein MYCTH_103671 [Thermothelomyces thermophilus ATCC 42464]